MTGKHRDWHRRWRLNREAATAEHGSGLTVRFVDARFDPPPDASVGGKSWTDDGREWLVLPEGGAEAIQNWLDRQAEAGLRGQNAAHRLSRLFREAGELWAHKRS